MAKNDKIAYITIDEVKEVIKDIREQRVKELLKFSSKETIKRSETEKFISCTKVLNFYACPVCGKVLVVEDELIKYDMGFSEKTTKIAFFNKENSKIEYCDAITINEQNEIEGVICISDWSFKNLR